MAKAKSNLLLAVRTYKVFCYKMTKENTISDIFLGFLKGLAKEINKDIENKYFLIMDNFRVHKTENFIDFFVKPNWRPSLMLHIIFLLILSSIHLGSLKKLLI